MAFNLQDFLSGVASAAASKGILDLKSGFTVIFPPIIEEEDPEVTIDVIQEGDTLYIINAPVTTEDSETIKVG